MELKELLEENKMIVKSELAKAMWPNIGLRSATQKLYSKLEEVESGTGTQRMTDGDISRAKEVLTKLRDNINVFLENK